MKSELDKYVIARVREKRLEQGVSQRAIAFTIGRSASFVGQVESDRFTTKYTVHQLYLIAKDLGCSPAEFSLRWMIPASKARNKQGAFHNSGLFKFYSFVIRSDFH